MISVPLTSPRRIATGIRTLLLPLIVLAALPSPAEARPEEIVASAKRVEQRLDMRVGFAVIDTGDGTVTGYRQDERFAMASTFKALACAAALSRGEAVLAKKTTIRQADLLPHSPVTEKRVGTSINTRDLCEMTLRTSDNAAANAILRALGGPAEVTGFLRQIGDETTRLDRYEPELNEAKPGDPRDTTTPQAMAGTLRRLLLQDALDPQARDQLEEWMAANAVAGGLLRSRLPEGWQIADRSGAGGHGTRGVIALARPPQGAPLVIAIYMDGTKHPLKVRDAAIAEIGAAIFESYQR
ncbi:class A beta-lactamase [Rhizobium rosettiformans]|uniref:class A beta-lactamase n=1 Tax=Rhizobium rosettiformans TaxID=1368430 RepID=UPI00286380F2|nr:class A beta-lactamase [Rhizobium rosettiformans]MDR7026707.1 beta-lactamase class A [Rhizobium rosettiformans]MDR7064828.1 beta-lactamase class A [Rhizobium rosettiformans]